MSPPEIGRDRAAFGSRSQFGTYVGVHAQLRNQRALLMDAPEMGYVVAQFNDHKTGKGYGWWKFPRQDFQPDRDPIEAIDEYLDELAFDALGG